MCVQCDALFGVCNIYDAHACVQCTYSHADTQAKQAKC